MREDRSTHNARSRRNLVANRAYLHAVKSVPCADCGGVFDPVCMDFDHRPGEQKRFKVAIAAGFSLAVVKAEIAKCDIVCSNCHRIRTYRKRDHGQSVAAGQHAAKGLSAPDPTRQLTLIDVDGESE